MTQHTLTVIDSHLALAGKKLMYFYPAGDCDWISWPLREDRKDADKLESALYDSVNCEEILKPEDDVLLPDGTKFGFVFQYHFIRS